MADSNASATTLSLIALSTEGEPVVDATEIREAGPIAAIKSIFVVVLC